MARFASIIAFVAAGLAVLHALSGSPAAAFGYAFASVCACGWWRAEEHLALVESERRSGSTSDS